MESYRVRPHSGTTLFYLTTAMMYIALGLLALSPIAIIWLAADWLHDVFRESGTVLGSNPRLCTVLTIIAVSAVATLIADKIYHRVKEQQKRQLEHI